MKILHVFRAPVGGLFRHVRDLATIQAHAGHEVGVICSDQGGPLADLYLNQLAPLLKLGLTRIPMSRMPSLSDKNAIRKTLEIATKSKVDVLHGHGAKGGLYARLAGHKLAKISLYTPHSGVLNYSWLTPHGLLFLLTEKWLVRKGTGVICVCNYERDMFAKKIGFAGRPYRVIYNGLLADEFRKINLAPNASDIFYVGEMRHIKGVDVLIQAFSTLCKKYDLTLNMIGDGPNLKDYEALVHALNLNARVKFLGRLPTEQALAQGKLMVIPSRREAFPYIVLETIAAEIPLIATDVGGISEILPPHHLVPSNDQEALKDAIENYLLNTTKLVASSKEINHLAQQKFLASKMASDISTFAQELKSNEVFTNH